MTGEELFLAWAGSSAVVVGVWVSTLLVRQSPALRSCLWRIGLLAVWVVPLLALVNVRLPESPLNVPAPVATWSHQREGPKGPVLPAATREYTTGASAAPETARTARTHGESAETGRGGRPLLWLWIGGAAVGTLLVLRDLCDARRLVARSTPLHGVALRALVGELCEAAGLRRVPAVATSDETGDADGVRGA